MENKTDNLIHSIALVVGVKNEQVVREAALTVVDFYMPSNYTQEQLLEMLYLYLADGQEIRSIVYEFRSKLRDLAAI